MNKHDRLYFERRAEEELDCAQQATDPGAVKAHYELLGFYLNRLYPSHGGSAHEPRTGSARKDPS